MIVVMDSIKHCWLKELQKMYVKFEVVVFV